MTIRSDIVDAIIAELNAAPPSDVPLATTRRWIPDVPIDDPLIAVFPNEEEVTFPSGRLSGVARRGTLFSIQAIYPTDDVDGVDKITEQALAHIVATLGESNLGGLANSVIERGTTWQVEKMEHLVMIATVRFEVDYQTKRNDATVQA